MTTREAMDYLGKNERFIEDLAKKVILRPGWAVREGAGQDWVEDDVIRAKIFMDYGVLDHWVYAARYNVLYCRAEPHVDGLDSAIQRVAQQKERMMTWIQGREHEVDLVIKEVRPVMRYRDMAATSGEANPTGLQALLGLINQRRIKTLFIESRDRICIGAPWFLMEDLLKLAKTEVVVMNSVWPTKEMRQESFAWMQDILLVHKVLAGDIDNQSIYNTFMKGFDPRPTARIVHKIDAKMAQVSKTKKLRKNAWQKLPTKQRILDLEECWDYEDIWKARKRLGMEPKGD